MSGTYREIRTEGTQVYASLLYAGLSIGRGSERVAESCTVVMRQTYESVDVQYLKRFKELIIDADDDSTPIDCRAIADFMRFLDSPVTLRMKRGLMGASPSGGLTVAWGTPKHRLSIKFTGGGEALVVKISPDNPTTLDTVNCRDELEGIFSKCSWISSEKNITSSSMPAKADWTVIRSWRTSSRPLIGQQTG